MRATGRRFRFDDTALWVEADLVSGAPPAGILLDHATELAARGAGILRMAAWDLFKVFGGSKLQYGRPVEL